MQFLACLLLKSDAFHVTVETSYTGYSRLYRAVLGIPLGFIDPECDAVPLYSAVSLCCILNRRLSIITLLMDVQM